MKKLLPLFLALFCLASRAQTPVNGYAQVTSIAGAVINVANVNEANDTFEDGEYIIVMQMQDDVIGANTTNAATFGNLSAIQSAGKFEVAQILSHTEVAGLPNTITLTGALANAYNTGANSAVQIISFPQLGAPNYATAFNIGAITWNGIIGGVIAFNVPGVFTLNHNITANGNGFRGGSKNTPDGYTACDNTTYRTAIATRYAGKGEGIYKSTNATYGGARGHILNGGGGGNDVNAGGGGGGNYTTGGDGGAGWVPAGTGCSPVAGGLGGISLSANINGSRVFMGGGGGGGHENDNVGTAGANGGGIILIKTGTLVTTGACGGRVISANGNTAGNASNDGSGGGGAAGSIVIQANAISVVGGCPLSITTNGGNGGSSVVGAGVAHGGGGGGAQGAILISLPLPIANVTANSISGSGGTSCSGCPASVNGVSGAGPNNSGVIGDITGVLPVKLIYFTAESAQDKILLKWATASELNSSHFEIERSSDAVNFSPVATVKSKAQGGNSNVQLNYSAYDSDLIQGITYYRLKQVNLDGGYDYSGIVSISSVKSDNIKFVVYPNPNAGEFTADISGIENNHNVKILLFDMKGEMVFHSEFYMQETSGKVQITPETRLPKGIYTCTLLVEEIPFKVKVVVN